MKTSHVKLTVLSALTFLTLAACSPAENYVEEGCAGEACSERDLNAPVDGDWDAGFSSAPEETSAEDAQLMSTTYNWPAYKSSWGISKSMYDKAQAYYFSHTSLISNKRYVTLINFSLHSSQRRFVLFDLATGQVEFHNTAVGRNSDPDGDGYANSFSNTPESKKSSLGAYLTLGTYYGSHGYSMRLRGLESTNSNAESRAIVVHPADYVSDSSRYAGRSWGCPALDPKISTSVINKIKSGSLLYIGI
jgi:hypothetical protein